MPNVCFCPPFKKSFTSAETPGPGLWRLYISIHNWWPGPRQTAHYTCNMDSLRVSDACPRLDLTMSHHCVWSQKWEWHMCMGETVPAWAWAHTIVFVCVIVLAKNEVDDLVLYSRVLANPVCINSGFALKFFYLLMSCFLCYLLFCLYHLLFYFLCLTLTETFLYLPLQLSPV